jgi:hypothetical protein
VQRNSSVESAVRSTRHNRRATLLREFSKISTTLGEP